MAKKAGAPDWGKIQAEYLRGGKSYKQLAAKYGVNLSTLEKRAKRESWAELLRQTSSQVAAELPAKVAAVIADEAAEWTRETLRLARDARKLLAQRLSPEATQILVLGTKEGPEEVHLPFLNAPRDWGAFVKALSEVDRIGRTALGLDEKEPEKPPEESQGAGFLVVPADSDDWEAYANARKQEGTP